MTDRAAMIDSYSKRQVEHYRANAPRYVTRRRESAAYAAFLEVWARRLLEPWVRATTPRQRREQVVLDPMCGHGNLASSLMAHTDHVVLSDVSPDMLGFLDDHSRARCRVLPPADVCELPLEPASIDIVVISGGLHHVYGKIDLALEELHRVLRPGGMLLFGEPSDDFAPVRGLRRMIYRGSGSFDARTECGFRYGELRSLLVAASFGGVELRPFGSVGYLLMGQVGVVGMLRRSRSNGLFRLLRGFDSFVERTWGLRRSCLAILGSATRDAGDVG